jgi:hypothetical protein
MDNPHVGRNHNKPGPSLVADASRKEGGSDDLAVSTVGRTPDGFGRRDEISDDFPLRAVSSGGEGIHYVPPIYTLAQSSLFGLSKHILEVKRLTIRPKLER